MDALKTKNGADKEVQDYVMSHGSSKELMQKITDYLECAIPLYVKEGKAQLVVGLGCTGGQHRSLTFALLLAQHFEKMGFATHAYSRDSRKNIDEIRQR